MNPIKSTVLIVSLVLLAGCATTFRPWKLSEVEEGMDKAQVVGILGEPNSIETKNGAEFLYYSYREDYNPPPSNTDILSTGATSTLQKQQIKRSLQEYRYVVKLVDGKVQDYEELTD